MPITVKHADIFDPNFLHSLKLMTGTYKFPFKAAYNMARITRQVEKLEKEQGLILKDIAKKYFKKDEKGNWIAMKDAKGNPVHGNWELDETIENCKEKYQADHDAFMELTQTLESTPLKPEDFVVDGKEMDIQPAILSSIDCLFGEETVEAPLEIVKDKPKE